MTLRERILGLITLALLISIAVGSALTYWHSNKKVAVEMDAALSVGESAVRDAVEPLAKYTEPARQLQRIVSSFNGNRHLKGFWIGPTGASVAESVLLAPDQPVPGWFFEIFAGKSRQAIVPLPPRMADLGSVRLQTDSHSEVSEVWEDLSLKTLIVGAFTILVLTLVNSALGHALQPLDALSSALHKVGAGEYETNVPVKGPRELSSIYESFNVMAAQLAEMESQNNRLNSQLMSVQEEERADIARDLHDEFGPFLFSIDVDARAVRRLHDSGVDEGVGEGTDSIRNSVAHLQKHLKSILGRLRPTALLDLGLSHALEHLVEFWSHRHPEISIHLSVSQTTFGERPDDICYRVVQESLSNSVRHGKPTIICVQISEVVAGLLRVTVVDNGEGVRARGKKGFGLAGMRERIVSVGGNIMIGNRTDGSGFSVLAEVPIELHRAEIAGGENGIEFTAGTSEHENIGC